MLKHKYLINLGDPEDCVEHFIDQDRDAGFHFYFQGEIRNV